ncbi:GA module-containing protein, partial [Weissella minor]|uniref:LPXTG cell wall anchor domain-containing protein n=1 Tax=Weissella minor TaxID=1620 RepID=UPI001BAF543E
VDSATSTDAIDQIVKDATDLNNQKQPNNNQALEDAKRSAKDAIDKLPNLSDAEKNDFKQRVDSATSTNAIDQIVKDATDLNNQKQPNNNQALEDAKRSAKDAIDKLPNLNDFQKNNLKKQIDASSSIDEINHILSLADRLNNEPEKSNVHQQTNSQEFKTTNVNSNATKHEQAKLPNTGANAQQNVGALGAAMLGTLALFGLGKRQNKRDKH